MLTGIPAHAIDDVAHRATPLIQRGLEATRCDRYWSPEWVLEQCKARDKQMWIGGDFQWLVISQINAYPTGMREIEMFLVSGSDAQRWMPETMDTMLAFGNANGCETIAGHGRKGWLKWNRRLFKDDGVVTYRMVQEI